MYSSKVLAYSILGESRARLLCLLMQVLVAQSSYDVCAKREVPLILLPNLKNKMAIGTISVASTVLGIVQRLRKGVIARAMKPSTVLAH